MKIPTDVILVRQKPHDFLSRSWFDGREFDCSFFCIWRPPALVKIFFWPIYYIPRLVTKIVYSVLYTNLPTNSIPNDSISLLSHTLSVLIPSNLSCLLFLRPLKAEILVQPHFSYVLSHPPLSLSLPFTLYSRRHFPKGIPTPVRPDLNPKYYPWCSTRPPVFEVCNTSCYWRCRSCSAVLKVYIKRTPNRS